MSSLSLSERHRGRALVIRSKKNIFLIRTSTNVCYEITLMIYEGGLNKRGWINISNTVYIRCQVGSRYRYVRVHNTSFTDLILQNWGSKRHLTLRKKYNNDNGNMLGPGIGGLSVHSCITIDFIHFRHQHLCLIFLCLKKLETKNCSTLLMIRYVLQLDLFKNKS